MNPSPLPALEREAVAASSFSPQPPPPPSLLSSTSSSSSLSSTSSPFPLNPFVPTSSASLTSPFPFPPVPSTSSGPFVFTAASSSAPPPSPAPPPSSFLPRLRSTFSTTGGPSAVAVNVLPFSPTSHLSAPPPARRRWRLPSLVPSRSALLRFRRPLLWLSVCLIVGLITAQLTSFNLAQLQSTFSLSSSRSPPPLPTSAASRRLHSPSSAVASSDSSQCLNSLQGRSLIVDDRGVVCPRQSVSLSSGCCEDTESVAVLSCRSCRADLGCCHSYEFCVSCCIGEEGPGAGGATDRTETLGLCLDRCRTSSRSVHHGNVYRTAFHHCYTAQPPHSTSLALLQPSFANLSAAPLGVPCDAHCASLSLTCEDEALHLANSCAQLERHFPCQACEVSEGPDQPAWVTSAAGAGFPEGRCLVARGAAPASSVRGGRSGRGGGAEKVAPLTCDGRHEKTRRLCVCVPERKVEDVEIDHFAGDEDT